MGWGHIDWKLGRHLRRELTTAEASAAKIWHTELQGRGCDAALQLHGGAGYMNEYLIGRLWRDARVSRICGGTNEIMKELISRSISDHAAAFRSYCDQLHLAYPLGNGLTV